MCEAKQKHQKSLHINNIDSEVNWEQDERLAKLPVTHDMRHNERASKQARERQREIERERERKREIYM